MPVYQPIDLDQLIEQANSLEPLPASAVRLAAILSQEEWDLDDVTPVVSLDQGLTGKLLSAANSAASGARDQIATVEQAVVRLGAGTVLALGVGAAVRDRVNVALPEYGLSEEQLWTHSVASAVIADGIRDFTERQIPVEVTTAALLHDVGKLVLARHLDASLLQYLHNARGDGGLSEQRAEMEILGVNHAELGCLIAQHWNLPEIICRGIGYHHAPGDYFGDDRETLVAHGVHLANRVATFVCGEDSEMPEADAMLAASKIRLGLSRRDYETMCNEMRDNFIEISGMYG